MTDMNHPGDAGHKDVLVGDVETFTCWPEAPGQEPGRDPLALLGHLLVRWTLASSATMASDTAERLHFLLICLTDEKQCGGGGVAP